MKRSLLYLIAALALSIPPIGSAQEGLAKQMETAIAQLRSTGSPDQRAIAFMLASCAEGYIQMEDYDTALIRIQESLKLCRENDIDPMTSFFVASKILNKTDDELATGFLMGELQAKGTTNLYKKGVLKALDLHLAINGNQKLAVQASFQLWQIVKAETPDTDEEFWALFKYGTNCLAAKLFDLAGPALKDARTLALKIKKPDLAANCSVTLGSALAAGGNYEEALKLFNEAANFSFAGEYKHLVGYSLQNMATIQLQLNQLDQAEKSLTAGAKTARNEVETALFQSIQSGLALKQALAQGGKPDLSAAIKIQKQVIANKLKNTAAGEEFAYLTATQDFITLASYQILGGDLDGAEESLTSAKRGADAWEANSRKAEKSAVFSADQVNLSMTLVRADIVDFQQQIELLQGDVVKALVTVENGRGAAQAELLKERLGLPTSDRVMKEMDENAIAEIAKSQQTTLVIYSLTHALTSDSRRFFTQKDRLQHPQAISIWVVSPNGKFVYRKIPTKGPIGKLVDLARKEITSPPKEKPEKSSLAILTSVIIDPIRDALPKEEGSLITFIPQGELFLVPFAALPAKDGTTLIDQYIIGMSPSIELLQLAAQQKQAVNEAGLKEILLVGNPTMPGYQSRPDRAASALSPLPGAEAEAKYLGKMLKTEPLIGDAATETAVAAKMENARFIHFATHGLLETESNFNQAFLSAIAFAASPGEDGFLTVKETARMNLRAELAVLSACDTGRGQISGDGVIGLSRGYISAGVPTVVVSLWPVSDQATAVMMGSYYHALIAGEPKAAALRHAILETKKKFPAPNLWAPFVLYGLAK